MRVSSMLVVCLVFGVAYAEVATQYKDKIIDKHNELRRKPSASNMNELVWSDTLAQEADAWIGRCVFEHENKGRGENLAFNTAADESSNIEQAFTDWYNEIKDYNYASKSCSKVCGHYTQLVWAETREVGCAMKRCPSLSVFGKGVQNGWIFGCWYSPQGNFGGDFPYITGGSCSECLEGQTCNGGLCQGEGKEKCFDKDANCETYGKSQCTSNPKYMERNCRQTCELCTGGPQKECKDVSDMCTRFDKRQCAQNEAWMKPNCRKTCGFC